jgi:hypothetical protein
MVEVTVDVDDALYKAIQADGTLAAKVQEKTKAKVDVAVNEMIKAMEAAAAKPPADQKAADAATKALNDKFEEALTKAGKEVNEDIKKRIDDFKKGKSNLQTFRIKSAVKIAITGTCVIAATAAAGASHGALTPIAAVGIVRGGHTIAQECVKLASTADTVAVLIKGQIAALKVIMQKDMKGASVKKQVVQGAKEVALGVLSGLTGSEAIPSMKNCGKNIELHKVDITKLEIKSKELSVKLTGALNSQDEWKKTNDAAIKKLPADKIGKIRAKIETIDKAVAKLTPAVVKVNEGVTRAEDRQKLFEETLNAMKDGLPEWIGYADTVAALGLGVGLAIGDASTLIDGVGGVLLEAANEIGNLVVEKA